MRNDHRVCPQGSHSATYPEAGTIAMRCTHHGTEETYPLCAGKYASGKPCMRPMYTPDRAYCKAHEVAQ